MTRSREYIILSDNKMHPKKNLVTTVQKYKLRLVVINPSQEVIQPEYNWIFGLIHNLNITSWGRHDHVPILLLERNLDRDLPLSWSGMFRTVLIDFLRCTVAANIEIPFANRWNCPPVDLNSPHLDYHISACYRIFHCRRISACLAR